MQDIEIPQTATDRRLGLNDVGNDQHLQATHYSAPWTMMGRRNSL